MVKGQVHTVEVLFVTAMMFTFLYYFLKPPVQTTEDYLKDYGTQVLSSLDNRGILRNRAVQENATGIQQEAASILPSYITSSVQLCYSDHCTSETLPNTTVFTISYVLAGNSTFFRPTEVLLHLW